MTVIQKCTAKIQKLCRPGIREFATAIFLTFAVLSLRGFTLAPGNGSSPRFAVLGTGSSPGDASSASEERADPSLSGGSTPERKTETSIATVVRSEEKKPLQRGVTLPSSNLVEDHVVKRRKKKPPVPISEMNEILLKNRHFPSSMVPRWSSPSDRQILEAKKKIMKARTVEDDPELYSPLFRNISMFKRSYELMEKMLRVYVYKEGEKPIFHQPHLTGIYASEGWFLKHMEASKRFVVDDPSKAHLFYIPFSSDILCSQLYVPGSHGHKNLVKYMNNYVETIAMKHPFWNRTAGADHFVAACHDWAADETSQAMRNSIRALCNADVSRGFELGKDVSLPQTNVHWAHDPLRDLGGRPAKKRPVLAFFAGQMHGYLRPVLLQQWENKDPKMKLFGQMPQAGERSNAMTYEEYMKSSRYCICPRGYEVSSPRVVEAIFHGCVPVIISDNFVPPFFEVLNWEAFSVIVAEDDIPRLKEILVAIPRKKYLELQMGVSMVQRHFLWHNNQPVKYDMFHMILHSVWFNRVLNFQVE